MLDDGLGLFLELTLALARLLYLRVCGLKLLVYEALSY
jgi:hypothetical protein